MIVSVAVPLFDTVNVCVADDPVATLPNEPVAPVTATVVVVVGSAGALALVNPVQPACTRQIARSGAKSIKMNGLRGLDTRGRTCISSAAMAANGVIR